MMFPFSNSKWFFFQSNCNISSKTPISAKEKLVCFVVFFCFNIQLAKKEGNSLSSFRQKKKLDCLLCYCIFDLFVYCYLVALFCRFSDWDFCFCLRFFFLMLVEALGEEVEMYKVVHFQVLVEKVLLHMLL